jgi:hypothetical protein
MNENPQFYLARVGYGLETDKGSGVATVVRGREHDAAHAYFFGQDRDEIAEEYGRFMANERMDAVAHSDGDSMNARSWVWVEGPRPCLYRVMQMFVLKELKALDKLSEAAQTLSAMKSDPQYVFVAQYGINGFL